jgi:hypothetical protein
MRTSDIRNWLGLFFLITTGAFGTYVILFGETRLLPIERQAALDTFEIIVPALVGQLTLIFKWYSQDTLPEDDHLVNLPVWVVKGPPIMVASILSISIVWLILSSHGEKPGGWLDAASFKGIVTFAVTLMNATTFFVLFRYFETANPRRSPKKTVGEKSV